MHVTGLFVRRNLLIILIIILIYPHMCIYTFASVYIRGYSYYYIVLLFYFILLFILLFIYYYYYSLHCGVIGCWHFYCTVVFRLLSIIV